VAKHVSRDEDDVEVIAVFSLHELHHGLEKLARRIASISAEVGEIVGVDVVCGVGLLLAVLMASCDDVRLVDFTEVDVSEHCELEVLHFLNYK